MKPHKVIWLQYEEPDPDGMADEGDITWCQDKINDSDVKYLLADEAEAKIAELSARCDKLTEALDRLAKVANQYARTDTILLNTALHVASEALRDSGTGHNLPAQKARPTERTIYDASGANRRRDT
jgi:hypothetical protein